MLVLKCVATHVTTIYNTSQLLIKTLTKIELITRKKQIQPL